MWLPRRLYELLPYAYIVAGAAVLVAALFRERGPHGLLMLLGGLFLTLGLVLWMRRREYRQNQAEYDPHALDD
jgi:LPXTG-motif cell wall-anchored protein